MTGGSGLLGGEIKKLIPNALYPSSNEFNLTNYEQMEKFIASHPEIKTILHAAAFTAPPKCEEDPISAIEANINGTGNIAKLCIKHDLKLIYVSTDYVFKGDKGNYKEDDPMSPINKYSWSKLGGECAVRMHDNILVIRTSFGPVPFQYPKAFTDQWTSRQSSQQVAEKIAKLTKAEEQGTYHVGTKRRTVHEYAKDISPDQEIGEISIEDIPMPMPVDTSLDTSKYEKFAQQTNQNE
jgi:dTDP-4-dehydrorhamnose reductase